MEEKQPDIEAALPVKKKAGTLPQGAVKMHGGRANSVGDLTDKGNESVRRIMRMTVDLGEMPDYKSRGRVIAPPRTTVELVEAANEQRVASVQERLEDVDEHTLSIASLAERYGVSIDETVPDKSQGLSSAEAKERITKEGLNCLTPPEAENAFLQFIKLLRDPLTVMLLVAAVLSLVTKAFSPDDWTPIYLGSVLLVVVLANTTVDFVQARKSASMLKSLSNLAPPKALALRDGTTVDVPAQELARGDVVILRAGDKVPADVRLVGCTDMTVDNSNLTGENEPQKRAVSADSMAVLEAENLAFMGTTVVNGRGVGVVIRRGDASILGRIASLAGAPKEEELSPLALEIRSFVIMIALGAFLTAIILFAVSMGTGNDFISSLSLFIGIFVACTPQGLPATVTMLLAFAAKELAKHNVLVKNLHAVDTLGAITLLCSDKTGTLTMNRMTVVSLWEDLKEVIDEDRPIERPLPLCMVLCNSADFVRSEANAALPVETREVLGDATETALLRYVAAHISSEEVRSKYATVMEVPFNSDKKWAARIVKQEHETGDYVVYFKGAPERVAKRCATFVREGTALATEGSAEFQDGFKEAYESMAGRGQRVIACAMLKLPRNKYPLGYTFTPTAFPDTDLVFLGLVGLQDPPKPGVAQAVDECNTAGIQVMMITGDHPLTAEAIAREVHIVRGKTRAQAAKELGMSEKEVPTDKYDAVVLHGEILTGMDEDQWAQVLSKREVVFARTSPQQKLEIVTRAQAMGHVTAMTGDGVNDSPALRRADMGIAMAITGSEVSREAAALVLLDDNFVSIVEGIRRGRAIFANMKKAIQYTLSHIMGELVPSIILLAAGLPLALNAFLILFLDLGTEIAPALSFAYESPDADAMQRKPRRAVRPRDVFIEAREVPVVAMQTSLRIAEGTDDLYPKPPTEPNSLMHWLSMFRMGCKGLVRRFVDWGSNASGDEKLVDWPLLYFAYVQAGFMECLIGYLTYFLVFYWYGVSPASLVDSSPPYFPADSDKDVFTAMDGKQVDSDRQDSMLRSVQSAFFFVIVIMQFFTAYILKATDNVLWSRKAWDNKTTYIGMVFSTCIAFICTFIPGIQTILSSNHFPLWALLVPIGGGFVYILVEACRRVVVRRFFADKP